MYSLLQDNIVFFASEYYCILYFCVLTYYLFLDIYTLYYYITHEISSLKKKNIYGAGQSLCTVIEEGGGVHRSVFSLFMNQTIKYFKGK